jgi:hypothetical protein
MKLSISILVAVGLLTTQAYGWIFNACGQQFDGDDNHGCIAKPCGKGSAVDWDRGIKFIDSCTVRIYSDSTCKNQIGIASDDWENHILTQDMGSFNVDNC